LGEKLKEVQAAFDLTGQILDLVPTVEYIEDDGPKPDDVVANAPVDMVDVLAVGRASFPLATMLAKAMCAPRKRIPKSTACAQIHGELLRRLADGRRQWIRGGTGFDGGTDGDG
jgi:hypothetical protein